MAGNKHDLIDKLAGASNLRNYPPEHIIQHQREPVSAISFILSGQAYAQHVTIDGAEFWIDEFTEGDIFGFEAWIDNTKANCNVTALSDVSLISISVNELKKIAKDDPQIMIMMMEALVTKFRTQAQRIIEAESLSSRGRICAELKRYSKPIGIDPGSFIIRPIPVFSKFATRVGSTRESVSRTISDLTRKGIILRQTGALVISNMPELEAQIR